MLEPTKIHQKTPRVHNITTPYKTVAVLKHEIKKAKKRTKKKHSPEKLRGCPQPNIWLMVGWLVSLPHIDMQSARLALWTRLPPPVNMLSTSQPIPTRLGQPIVTPQWQPNYANYLYLGQHRHAHQRSDEILFQNVRNTNFYDLGSQLASMKE